MFFNGLFRGFQSRLRVSGLLAFDPQPAVAGGQSHDKRRRKQPKTAAEAERDVDALYLVAYMKDKVGEEYEASLSGVTSFGLFAELKNTVEGFIRTTCSALGCGGAWRRFVLCKE